MRRSLTALFVTACFIASSFARPARPADDVHTQWNALVDAYFDQVFFPFDPANGTSDGLHQYDAQLEDYSRAGVDKQIAAYRGFEKRVADFNPQGLTQAETADRDMVLSNIRGALLTLETIR